MGSNGEEISEWGWPFGAQEVSVLEATDFIDNIVTPRSETVLEFSRAVCNNFFLCLEPN